MSIRFAIERFCHECVGERRIGETGALRPVSSLVIAELAVAVAVKSRSKPSSGLYDRYTQGSESALAQRAFFEALKALLAAVIALMIETPPLVPDLVARLTIHVSEPLEGFHLFIFFDGHG